MKPWSLKISVSILFLLSGLCGLVYEVAWFKYLSLFIGNTTYSQMIVLATYMAGLALGALFWGKSADQVKSPLKLYGLLEIAIGLYCFSYPHLISWAEALFIRLSVSADGLSSPTTFLALKFLLSFSTLFIPTFLMGGTIPILTRFLSKNLGHAGRDVAQLYFINSLGAVIGAGLTGFLLIRYLALDGAVYLAASLNCFVGLCAWLLSKFSATPLPAKPTKVKKTELPIANFSRSEVRIALMTAVITGFIAMIYQMTWTRLLANILGSTTYSFTVMLMTFISGIAIGSWIVSILIQRVKNLPALLGYCQLSAALSILVTLPLYERLPYFLLKLSNLLLDRPDHFTLFLGAQFLFCFGIMIVPTTLSGMALPLASRIASNDFAILGKSIGGVFFTNTMGAVLGAITTSLLFIPLIGIKSSLELGLILNGLLGLIIIFSYSGFKPRLSAAFALVFVLMVIGYKVLFPTWNENALISGVFRTFNINPAATYQEFKQKQNEGQKILWYKEGVNANVAIRESSFGDTLQKSLVINGKADASSIGDLQTQILLGQIPLMLFPDSGDALVIGLGSGITCGSALRHPIKSLDVVEIASEVVEANSFFANDNYHFMADPRVKVHIEDALTYLKTSPKKYSYIISEPSNPWIAGIGNLYSLEFFKLCKSRLQSGGVLAQWFHTYDISDDVFKLVLSTISQAFPSVTIWKASDADIVILASENIKSLNFESMDQKMLNPRIANDLARIKIFDIPSLLSTQVMSARNSPFQFMNREPNTYQKPLLEFLAPLSLFSHASVRMIDSIDERISLQDNNLWFFDYAKLRPLTFENFMNISRYRHTEHIGDLAISYSALDKSLELDSVNIEALNMLARLENRMGLNNKGQLKEHREKMRLYVESNPDDIEGAFNYIMSMIDNYQRVNSVVNPQTMDDAVTLARKCIAMTGGREEQFHIVLGALLTGATRYSEAAEAYLGLSQLQRSGGTNAILISEWDLLGKIGESYYNAGNLVEAEKFVERALSIRPGDDTSIVLQKKIALKKLGVR
jgi:spermidine synthase